MEDHRLDEYLQATKAMDDDCELLYKSFIACVEDLASKGRSGRTLSSMIV